MRPLAAMTAPLLTCMLLALAAGAGGAAEREPAQGLAQRVASLGKDKYGELVAQGYRIFTATPKHAYRYSGNALSCQSCHLDGGTRRDAAPLWAAWGQYPAYVAKRDRVVSFEERIQDCFRFSLNGLAPPLDSHEMRALVAYSHWLSQGEVVGANPPGRGFPSLARTGQDSDPQRGKAAFASQCAACHGAQGEGRRGADGAYLFPPLWGANSYNKGAGMHRTDLLAGFIKANMPLGNPTLSNQQALDIAAWIQLQERWPDPRKGLLQGLLDK
ncbi:c-type cytochrome [Oxalobacteraceae bacterium]|nr:c-type cytochrome [Oxalobacteraceae bacterium]